MAPMDTTTTATPAAVRYRNLIFDSARWSEIDLRPGDIVVSTPPKSGTTWMQMLCALLVFDGPDLPAPLERLSPWVDMLDRPIAEVRATLDAQQHRRILKTHTPLDGLPWRDDVHYVVVGRDPRDVAVSFDHHLANLDVDRFLELRSRVVDPTEPVPLPGPPADDAAARFRQFVTSDEPDGLLTLAQVLHHLEVAWERRHLAPVHLVHYADLRRDPVGQLLGLAGALGVDLTPERAAQLTAEATLDRMRERADEVAPSASLGLWRDTRRFIRTGGQGEWRATATASDERTYAARVAALVDVDLARWAHHGAG
jgi:aryl sulfotransferase